MLETLLLKVSPFRHDASRLQLLLAVLCNEKPFFSSRPSNQSNFEIHTAADRQCRTTVHPSWSGPDTGQGFNVRQTRVRAAFELGVIERTRFHHYLWNPQWAEPYEKLRLAEMAGKHLVAVQVFKKRASLWLWRRNWSVTRKSIVLAATVSRWKHWSIFNMDNLFSFWKAFEFKGGNWNWKSNQLMEENRVWLSPCFIAGRSLFNVTSLPLWNAMRIKKCFRMI